MTVYRHNMGSSTTTDRLMKALRTMPDVSFNELAFVVGVHPSSIRSNLYYYIKIGMVERTGIKK